MSSIKLCVNSFHEFNFPLFLTLVCLPSFAGFDLVVKNFDNVCFWVLHVKIKLGYCRICRIRMCYCYSRKKDAIYFNNFFLQNS